MRNVHCFIFFDLVPSFLELDLLDLLVFAKDLPSIFDFEELLFLDLETVLFRLDLETGLFLLDLELLPFDLDLEELLFLVDFDL